MSKSNIIQLPNPQRPKPSEREKLANLLYIPRKYRMLKTAAPSFEPINIDDDYTKDELIFAIGSAMPEIATFAMEHDLLKKDFENCASLVAEMHFHATGRRGPVIRGAAEDVEKLRERFNRLFQVTHKLIYHYNEKTQKAASEFFEQLNADIQADSPLVNENGNGNGSEG